MNAINYTSTRHKNTTPNPHCIPEQDMVVWQSSLFNNARIVYDAYTRRTLELTHSVPAQLLPASASARWGVSTGKGKPNTLN